MQKMHGKITLKMGVPKGRKEEERHKEKSQESSFLDQNFYHFSMFKKSIRVYFSKILCATIRKYKTTSKSDKAAIISDILQSNQPTHLDSVIGLVGL